MIRADGPGTMSATSQSSALPVLTRRIAQDRAKHITDASAHQLDHSRPRAAQQRMAGAATPTTTLEAAGATPQITAMITSTGQTGTTAEWSGLVGSAERSHDLVREERLVLHRAGVQLCERELGLLLGSCRDCVPLVFLSQMLRWPKLCILEMESERF